MIDSKRVNEILMDCLFKSDEIVNGGPKQGVEWVEVNGLTVRIGLVKSRLDSHREEVVGFLSQLKDDFWESKGGGQTFLNMCEDREGSLWGQHQDCEELILLGLGLDLVSFLFPRDMWSTLPGGVPYVCVKL